MTDMDRSLFAKGLGTLGVIFSAPVTTETIAAYWEVLRTADVAEFQRAVTMAGRTLRFFPKPAELLELAGQGPERRKWEASVAWDVVYAAMNKYDYTESVDFGPLVNATLRNLGGWQWICERSRRDLTFDRKKFEELYVLLAEHGFNHQRGGPLRGAFGGKPVLFQIPGQAERRVALPEPEDDDAKTLVHQLADAKGVG